MGTEPHFKRAPVLIPDLPDLSHREGPRPVHLDPVDPVVRLASEAPIPNRGSKRNRLPIEDEAPVLRGVAFYNLAAPSTMWLSAFIFAPFAAAVVAMSAWRETFLALSCGGRVHHIVRLGLALGGRLSG
jgi:hypothetical protein